MRIRNEIKLKRISNETDRKFEPLKKDSLEESRKPDMYIN